jgi:hypothetical protein
MPHLIQIITNCLLQLLPWFIGPFGGLIISLLVNIGLLFLVMSLLGQLATKDKKINDLIDDLKLLVIKSQVSEEEFKGLIENKFFTSQMEENKENQDDAKQ